jgi:hypothetical protein
MVWACLLLVILPSISGTYFRDFGWSWTYGCSYVELEGINGYGDKQDATISTKENGARICREFKYTV